MKRTDFVKVKSEIHYIARIGTTSKVLHNFLLNQEYDVVTNQINLSLPEIKNIANQPKFPPWQETFNNLDNLQTLIPEDKLNLKMMKIQFQGHVVVRCTLKIHLKRLTRRTTTEHS